MPSYQRAKCAYTRRKVKLCGNDPISECLQCGHKEHIYAK